MSGGEKSCEDDTFYEAVSDYSDDFQDALEEGGARGEDTLHRLAFDGDVTGLERSLRTCSAEERAQLDMQGNSILHLAVLRNNKEVLEAALKFGIPTETRNARGWTALDEAIASKNKELVSLLYQRAIQEVKTEMKNAKLHLMQTLKEMPDYSMELSWQLGSPVIGYLLRKFAPHDTYKIYKVGSKIRVDGTLMGIEKSASSLLPEWKRGDFSLLFDGNSTPASISLLLHDKKEYLDLTEEKLERKRSGKFDFDADLIISNGAGKTKLRATDVRFKPVKGWLTTYLTEKIENWNTRVYEASGKMVAVRHVKSNLIISENCTFDEYLAMSVSDDKVVEVAVNPPGLTGASPEEEPEEVVPEKKIRPKKLTGRCWMAEDFPMSLRQLLPLLDVVGHANKHLSRVSKFMRKYSDMNMFPVRIQIPLLLTVYLLVSFKKFKSDTTQPLGWCDVPAGYKRVKLEDMLSSPFATLQRTSPSSREQGHPSNSPRESSFDDLMQDPIDF